MNFSRFLWNCLVLNVVPPVVYRGHVVSFMCQARYSPGVTTGWWLLGL